MDTAALALALFDFLRQWGGIGIALFVMIVVLFVLVRVVLPDMLATFRAEIQAERDTWAKELAAQREQHERHVTVIIGRLDLVEANVREVRAGVDAIRQHQHDGPGPGDILPMKPPGATGA